MSSGFRFQYLALSDIPPSFFVYWLVNRFSELKYAKYSPDNAVMIGWTSIYRFLAQDTDDYDIGLRPKWSIEDI